MATRNFTRAYGNTASDTFAKMGDDGHRMVNVSGAPSANTLMAPRDSSAITAPPPGRPLSHRQPVQIDAHSGQRLGGMTEASPAWAVRSRTVKEAASCAGACSCEQETLDHIFGLNLPRRGRA